MPECKHEIEFLIGTADGIHCRKCGAQFKTFAEIHAAPAKEETIEATTEPPKRGRKKKKETDA